MIAIGKNNKFNPTGNVFCVSTDENGKITSSLSVGEKLSDGTWRNSSLDATFVGEAKILAAKLISAGKLPNTPNTKENARIEILNGVISFVKSQDGQKEYKNITIFEFQVIENQP